jgi:hypothetical protein
MIRNFLILAALVALLAVAAPSRVHAYGAYHAGVTTVGPSGVQHYGTTTGPAGNTYTHTSSTTATPYGVQHTGTTTGTGAYGAGTVSSSSTRVYSPSVYNGYSAVGVSGTKTTTGVVRTGYVP